MAGTVGVFIRCEEIYHRECLKKLQSLMKPPETFVGAKKDNTHGGLKVFFKNNVTARSILREQYLLVSGNRFSIHPLSTTLIVHTELFNVSEDFEQILRNGVKHLGPVLTVSKLSLFEEFPDAFTGDWKVELDIPEIEDLILNGLSNNMALTLPGYEKGFPVTFCCPYCEEDGHNLKLCPKTGNVQGGPEFQTVTQSIRIDSVRSTSHNSHPLGGSNVNYPSNHVHTPSHSTSEERIQIMTPLHKDIFKSLEKIQSRLDNHTQMLHQLLLSRPNAEIKIESHSLPSLPLETMDDLNAFEEAIAEPSTFKEITKLLALQAGMGDVENCTRSVLKNLLAYKLAQHFNWLGQNNKRAFKDLNACRLVINCIRWQKRFENMQGKKIEDVIKAFLRYAPARHKYRNLKC